MTWSSFKLPLAQKGLKVLTLRIQDAVLECFWSYFFGGFTVKVHTRSQIYMYIYLWIYDITIYARIMIPWWRRARWWFIMRGISFTFQIEFVIIRHQDLTKLLPELDLSFFFFAVLPFCRTTLTSCWSIFLQATVARPAACGFVLHREAFSPLRLLLLLRPLFLFFLIYFFSSCLSVLLFLWLRILLWLAVLRLFKLVIGPA